MTNAVAKAAKRQLPLPSSRPQRRPGKARCAGGHALHDLAVPDALPKHQTPADNPMPVTAPAHAFGAALCDSTPITAAPTPIKEKVRSPTGAGTDPARLGSLHLAHEYQEERPSS